MVGIGELIAGKLCALLERGAPRDLFDATRFPAVEEALLVPQFAKSLWGRLKRGPMQMKSHLLGGDQFRRILEAERDRLGEAFDIRAFNDAILSAGPIPFDLIPGVFAGR